MGNLSATSTDLHVTCKGTLMDVRRAMLQVACFMRDQNAAGELSDDLNLVLSEAMTNIARHGYPREEGTISFHLRLAPDAVICRLTDYGIPYRPDALGLSSPDPNSFAEGGYGWFLIRSLTQTLSYSRADDMNILDFTIPRRPET
ncbi:MAG: ATP-binding protein [Roseinatronobacter sp.]